jgi:prepilin-type processing-associated H-X9-DG protein
VNNLKQMSLAAHNYESGNGSFPMGNRALVYNYSPAFPPCQEYIGFSAFVFILPYNEGSPLYNATNLTRAYDSAATYPTLLPTKMASYVCPSDTPATVVPPGYIQIAQASYGACRGTQETLFLDWLNQAQNAPDPTGSYVSTCNFGGGDGMFGPENVTSIAGVTDGLSNTFFFGEQSQFRNEPGGSPFWFNWIGSAWQGPPVNGPSTWTYDYRVTGGATCTPFLNAPADTTGNIFLNCFGPIGYPAPIQYSTTQACQLWGQGGFRSLHPGGANFAFADGSVKFIKNQINYLVYRNLSTRAGGEVLSSDQY